MRGFEGAKTLKSSNLQELNPLEITVLSIVPCLRFCGQGIFYIKNKLKTF